MDSQLKSFVGGKENALSTIFEYSIRFLIIFLPFTTFLSVLTSQKLGIPGFTYFKEILLLIGIICVGLNHFSGKHRIRWSLLDALIIGYMVYLIGISIFTTGIRGVIFGGRYDFEFLLMFWMVYHGGYLLQKPASYYLKLFLLSGGTMLFISGLLKFPLSEDLLLHIGYGGNPSAWQFGTTPPIFQGIDGANIRRFQGILDGPNTKGAFLIMFSGVFAYYMREKKGWYFVNGIILFGLIVMVIYTFSRSALLGLMAGYIFAFIYGLRYLYRRYKMQVIAIFLTIGILGSTVFVMYSGTINAIVGRSGSTKGHLDRMMTSVERFVAHPFGQGLGSSGPAYRHVQELGGLSRAEIEAKDATYIPESWYIQQFVEGGIVAGILFLSIMFLFFWRLLHRHVILASMFIGIGIMNLFLHTFESAPFSLLFFLLIGIFLSDRPHGKHIYER